VKARERTTRTVKHKLRAQHILRSLGPPLAQVGNRHNPRLCGRALVRFNTPASQPRLASLRTAPRILRTQAYKRRRASFDRGQLGLFGASVHRARTQYRLDSALPSRQRWINTNFSLPLCSGKTHPGQCKRGPASWPVPVFVVDQGTCPSRLPPSPTISSGSRRSIHRELLHDSSFFISWPRPTALAGRSRRVVHDQDGRKGGWAVAFLASSLILPVRWFNGTFHDRKISNAPLRNRLDGPSAHIAVPGGISFMPAEPSPNPSAFSKTAFLSHSARPSLHVRKSHMPGKLRPTPFYANSAQENVLTVVHTPGQACRTG